MLERGMRLFGGLFFLGLLNWMAGAAAAQTINPGTDLLVTPSIVSGPDATVVNVAIPAGFLTGNSAFSGPVTLEGKPLMGNVPPTDTIVTRMSAANLPMIGSMATIPIEICALSLVSINPITVTFGTQTSDYDVQVCLRNVAQPTGSMTLTRSHANGGTFDSTLPVIPRFIFTKVSGTQGVATASMNGASVTLSSVGAPWSFTTSLSAIASGGPIVDHDCDPGTAMVACAGTTPNMFVSVPPGNPGVRNRIKEAHPMGVQHTAVIAVALGGVPLLGPVGLGVLFVLLLGFGYRAARR